MNSRRLRVLLVPDSVYWVTGTIAKSIARFNPWIEATIASSSILETILPKYPELISNFDLVHFVCPYASGYWLPHFRDRMPCVTSHHHVSEWQKLSHNLEGDAIMVVSLEWAEDLRIRGADMSRVFCVHAGVDAELFKPPPPAERDAARERLDLAEGTTLIGFFGKNSSNELDRKGIDIFTEAIVGLRRSLPDVAVLIIGPGWKELISSLKASGVRVIWFPFIPDLEGLAEMYRVLDFYWVTARVEGGPVTLLEAMSSAVCCLTTPVGLAREIVRDGHNAILLPFNNAEAFIERTSLLARDVAERGRIGRNARQTILAEMQVANKVTLVSEVYARAFENFVARRPPSLASQSGSVRGNSALPLDVHEIALRDGTYGLPANENPNEVPLAGLPNAIHELVRMLETLRWSENLFVHLHQPRAALRMILREWLANPFSPFPPKVLLRCFLPVSAIERMSKFKNRSRGPTELIANGFGYDHSIQNRER